MKYINIILFSVIVGEAIISCGGGGSGGGGENNSIRKIEGYVIDGNISEANVSIYKSNNTIYEANVSVYNQKYKIPNGNTTTTDKRGKYSFSIDSNISKVDIISHGGKDILTEEIFEGILQARISFDDGGLDDKIFVTPLSTLLAVSDGDKDAVKIVKYNLGIDKDFNLINDNPLSEGMDYASRLKLFQGTQQVQKVAEIIKNTLRDDIYYEQIFKAIYLTMADNYNINNRAVVNGKEILKSPWLTNNVIKFIKSEDRDNAKIKLDIISFGITSTVNLIYGDDVDIKESKDMKLTAMAIEVVTNSYEDKAREIVRQITKHVDVNVNANTRISDLKADMDAIKLSYVSLDKVIKVVELAQKSAKENNKVVSLPLLGAFLAKKISSNGGSIELNNKNIQSAINQSVVTQEKKNNASYFILSNNPKSLSGDAGTGLYDGTPVITGGGGGGGNNNNTPQVTIIIQDGNAKIINDSNKSNYPKIPYDGKGKNDSLIAGIGTGTEQNSNIGKPAADGGGSVPDVVNSDVVPVLKNEDTVPEL